MSGPTSGVLDGAVPARGRRRGVALAVGGALAVGAAVVAVDVAGAPSAQAASLTRFGSCEELTGWYRDAALEQVGAWGAGGGGGIIALDSAAAAESAGGAPAPAAADAGAARTGGAVGSSGTGTNVQEEGVDEPSRLKLVDGLAYSLTIGREATRLVVVDVAGGRTVGRTDLPIDYSQGEYATEIVLVDDRVVVFGSAALPAPAGLGTGRAADGIGSAGAEVDPLSLPPSGPSTTTMTTVDVSDPAAPTVLGRVEVEGGYVSARASDGRVRVVTSSTPVLPFVDPWTLRQQRAVADGVPLDDPSLSVEPDEEDEAEALARNEQVVRDATVADWLPDLVRRDAAGTVTGTEPVPCDAVAHPAEGAGTGTLTVLTLDPAADEPLLGTTSVSADGSLVYASTDRLYVATTRGGWLWGPGAGEETTTELHGFATTSPETPYLGSGSVEGWLLGPWAMDAADGYLRVGTTSQALVAGGDGGGGGDAVLPDVSRPALPAGDTSSSVVVLRETNDGLVETGRVDGLGPGEQIRSLRWFDDLAVVVTFEQTDPLYTVDLADPAAPRVLGELKVTGYSGYLHPVGDGMLIGVGQAGDEDGNLYGAKLETYDVRDLAAPRAVADVVWAGASSSVEQDSRLFAYLPGRRTAILTLDSWDPANGPVGGGLSSVSLGSDGVPSETGRWVPQDGGWVGGLATDGEVVVVQRESWELAVDGVPGQELAVLDPGDLSVRAEVDLG